jgi:NitT/TauT family transport system substrate-binding protein
MHITQSRRDFLTTLSATGAVSVVGGALALADEGPPETTRLRLLYDPNICIAPLYISEELLRAEGFTEIRWSPVAAASDLSQLARGEVDLDYLAAPALVSQLDAGEQVTVLAGLHPGCYELFANEPIRTISDLKDRRVGVQFVGSAGHLYLTILTAHVGLDPQADVGWVAQPDGNFLELLAAGEIDAFLAFPPEPQELRARRIGRVILNLTTDKPWSQYFCCMMAGNRAFVRDHPVATKRFVRAILKAADLCATEPQTAAQRLVDGKFAPRYDYALQTLTELPYGAWREYDPEDTLRFYALRLHEVGLIKSNPNKIIAEGTDWRFLNEIKRELKA